MNNEDVENFKEATDLEAAQASEPKDELVNEMISDNRSNKDLQTDEFEVESQVQWKYSLHYLSTIFNINKYIQCYTHLW